MHELIDSMVSAANGARRPDGLLLPSDVKPLVELLVAGLSEDERRNLGQRIWEDRPEGFDKSKVHRLLAFYLWPPTGGS